MFCICIAASWVVSLHILIDIADKHHTYTGSHVVVGYMLASLGRSLFHGDLDGSGKEPRSRWKIILADFIVLQGSFLKLYIDHYGSIYSDQLDRFIPLAFPPEFRVVGKAPWKSMTSKQFEPVYTPLRNWMFFEANILIDFGPYRPLVAIESAQDTIQKHFQRRVLIDVGANGFFASPKYLLDSYAPYLAFTHAIMIEPEPHFSASIPSAYSKRYNITSLPVYVEVGTNSSTDIVVMLPTLVTTQDFVVLKFDVDPNR